MARQYPLLTAIWGQSRVRIILILVLFAAIICLYLVQSLMVDQQLQDLSTEQFRLQQHVRQRQVEFANSGIPVSTAEQIEKNLRQFNRLIPSQEQFSQLLGDLFAWSQQTGLEIHQISYQPEQDEDTGFLRYGINFSVEGDYGQIKKFIYLLESAQRILIIDKIALTGRVDKKAQGVVSLRMTLTTYFQGASV